MKIRLPAFLLALLMAAGARADDLVRYASTLADGKPVEVAARLTQPTSRPAEGRPLAAVILLHSKGGWDYPVTEQYAQALSQAGFLVIEPRLFDRATAAPPTLSVLPMVYDALRYLAGRGDVDPQRIGVAGFSYGGALSLHAAAAWAQQRYGGPGGLKFAAHAPFYPVCWAFAAFAQGKRKTPGLPADAFTQWTGAPVRLFAGGRDDYDDRDAEACAGFVASLPPGAQAAFSVRLYAEATHGWDQRPASFYEPIACKGRGCTNINQADAAITRQSIADLVGFMTETLQPGR